MRRPLVLWLLLLALPTLALAEPRRPIVEKVTFSYLGSARATQPMSGAEREPQPKQPPLVPVPQVRQHSEASCGLGVTQMLCGYYTPDTPRGSLLVKKARGYTYYAGTPTSGFRQLLGDLGFTTKAKRNMRLGDLLRHTNRGDPVAIGAQAWATRPVDWKTDTEDGHYMLVLGFGDWNGKPLTSAREIRETMKKNPSNAIVWLADPAMSTGRRGWMPVGEFLDRWHWPGEKRLGIVAHPKHDSGRRARVFIGSSERIK